MAQLGQSKEALKKSGAAIFAISNETSPDLKKMQDKHKLDFVTFLSDTTGKAGKLYPGLYEGKTLIKPGTYVIGKDRKVVYAYLNEDYRTRAQTDAVLEALKRAQ